MPSNPYNIRRLIIVVQILLPFLLMRYKYNNDIIKEVYETDFGTAYEVYKEAIKRNIGIIHISTDYVFGKTHLVLFKQKIKQILLIIMENQKL